MTCGDSVTPAALHHLHHNGTLNKAGQESRCFSRSASDQLHELVAIWRTAEPPAHTPLASRVPLQLSNTTNRFRRSATPTVGLRTHDRSSRIPTWPPATLLARLLLQTRTVSLGVLLIDGGRASTASTASRFPQPQAPWSSRCLLPQTSLEHRRHRLETHTRRS